MLKWPMIHKRGEVYYLRLKVPLRVQAAYGKKAVWVSLRTRNLDGARVLALAASAKIKATLRRNSCPGGIESSSTSAFVSRTMTAHVMHTLSS
jgi:hypothetical protein